MAQSLPFQFDRYECRQDLGGGMTDVYRAWDTMLQRDVVIKILRPENARDPDTRQRFLREARLACRCKHENVVVTYDAGEFEGRPYVVMEFLEGRSLSTVIEAGELTDHTRVLRLSYDLANALDYVHSLDIIHRDIKPANVWIETSGRPKLLDFGIAKTPDLSQTAVDVIFGTLPYMAPEQLMGKPVSKSVDIYAFGAMMFEMFTRRRLVQTSSVEEAYAQIVNGSDLSPLDAVGVSPETKDIISRCLDKDLGRRFPNFAAVRTDLGALLSAVPAGAGARPARSDAPPAVTEVMQAANPGSKRMLVAFGGIAAALAILIALWLTFGQKKPVESKTSTPPPVLETVVADPNGAMRLVPGGEARIGPEGRVVRVPAFYMDETEVSVAAYQRFAAATGRPMPKGLESSDPRRPVTGVSLDDAKEFAQWAGKRLPTAVEWEKAARGAEGKPFPWGDTATYGRANIPGEPQETRQLLAVDGMSEGSSPYGIRNTVGNVWEWVNTSEQPDDGHYKSAKESFRNISPALTPTEPFYQIRGGSYLFYVPKEMLSSLVSDYSLVPARGRKNDIGFRCARTVSQ